MATPEDPHLEPIRALESEFGELITRFRRVLADNAERVSPGMLPAAYKVFTTIARQDRVPASAVAEQLMMDKGQLSRTVRELEQRGLVAREPDPADGRASLLFATPDGRARLAEARRPHESTLSAALRTWDVEDIRELTRLLHALVHAEPPR